MGSTCGKAEPDVVIDHDFEFVNRATHEHRSGALDQAAVHGKDVGSLRQHKAGWNCGSACGSPRHEGIVGRAVAMAREVGAEKEDVLHKDWAGPRGQDPLAALIGEESQERLGRAILELARNAQEVLEMDETLVEVSAPAKVFGDIHGQFRDMLLLLNDFGFPGGGTTYVFNGDWVDRGKHQLEVLCLVLALKVANPDGVVLLRGNHEDPEQGKHMGACGFPQACVDRLGRQTGQEVFAAMVEVFGWLPLGCLIDESILVVHGGIGDGTWDLDYLREVQRPLDHDSLAADHVVYNILWSDPIPEDTSDCYGAHDSPRDNHAQLIRRFGKDVTESFCERNGLEMIVRSHEAMRQGDGYEVMHGDRCVRVFSARDYEGSQNDGCVLDISRSGWGFGSGQLVVKPQVVLSLTKPLSMRHT